MNEESVKVKETIEPKEETQKGQMVAVERRYYIESDFTDKLANDFCQWVDDVVEFDELWEEQYPEKPLLPVVITISSRGGVVDSLNQMLDAMDDLCCPIITEVRGFAYSCGLFLFARGDIRIMGNSSRLMYHAILWTADGSLQDQRENLEESEKLMKTIDRMLIERTGIAKKTLDKHKRDKHDWFMTKDDAIKNGFVNFEGNLRNVLDALDEVYEQETEQSEEEKTIEELTEEFFEED